MRVREDKKPDDATDAEQVSEAYQRQATVMAGKKGKKGRGAGDDDGFW